MVFQSSHPVYLDPHTWQQQQPGENNPLLPPFPPPPPPAAATGEGGGGSAQVRPGSMAERARMAKLPQPEAGLKCPRCESTNTKFCYFNNYSLSQPRHFCKTCRRYWTRGGALRNVPVGGGCRRNKRSKRSRSKSPATTAAAAATDHHVGSTSGSPAMGSGLFSHLLAQPQVQLPLLSTLPHLGDFSSLNFTGIRPPLAASGSGSDMGFLVGSGLGGGSGLSARFGDQWRVQQVQNFPFLSATEPPPPIGIFPIGGGALGSMTTMAGELGLSKTSVDPGAEVKIEHNQGVNLSRNNVLASDQCWGGGNAWTDLSTGFHSSSTSHLL